MFPLKDNLRCSSPATVTKWLILANVVAFIIEVTMLLSGHQDQLFGTWLMVPGKVTAAFAAGDPSLMFWATVSIFSSMFLHGSFGHIFGNMVFLFVFGKGMENRIGKWNYLAFYLIAGVLAALTHWGSDPTSMIPTLGASGAIAGVLGGYLLFWANATISGFYVLPAPAYVHTKAYWFLIGWFVMQFSGVLSSVGPIDGAGVGAFFDADKLVRFGDGVAYWAHIGGFVAGFIMAGLAKIFMPKTDVCIIPKPECDAPEDHNKGSK
ncbi:MAG: rhomboid family intramembrane serine protease [Candidatus Obscuribacter sp.]|nr:rhomboid family intramembrane serine protease [Candidatus Melainabacteria bacterium]MDX1988097.1 rhomboid family intramembrane serine protease [Candidatus Obscuribacter sp.]